MSTLVAGRFAGWLIGRSDCSAGGLGLVIDLDVEVALALEVVAQAAVAFVEQVFVDAAFFKDGDEVLDALRSR